MFFTTLSFWLAEEMATDVMDICGVFNTRHPGLKPPTCEGLAGNHAMTGRTGLSIPGHPRMFRCEGVDSDYTFDIDRGLTTSPLGPLSRVASPAVTAGSIAESVGDFSRGTPSHSGPSWQIFAVAQ